MNDFDWTDLGAYLHLTRSRPALIVFEGNNWRVDFHRVGRVTISALSTRAGSSGGTNKREESQLLNVGRVRYDRAGPFFLLPLFSRPKNSSLIWTVVSQLRRGGDEGVTTRNSQQREMQRPAEAARQWAGISPLMMMRTPLQSTSPSAIH